MPNQGKSSMIANIKMEIARINAQVQNGMISQEEAQTQLALLEAKLSALESGQNIDTADFSTPITNEPDIKPIDESTETNNESSDEQNDNEQRQESFIEQQAVYNRVFHGI